MLYRWMAAAAVGCTLLLGAGAPSVAAEIRLISSNAIKSVIEDVAPKFQKATGHTLNVQWGPAVQLKAEIEKGAGFDLTVLTVAALDDLIGQGKLVGASRSVLASSGIGVAVRKGAARPDIGTTEAFRRMLLNARSVGVVEQGTAGIYLKDLLQRLKIADALQPRLEMIPTDASAAVERGEVEIGFTQISEIVSHPNAELLGPLPADIQQITVFGGAIGSEAKEPEAARALLRFLTAPATASVFKAKGLDPAK